MKYCRRMKYFVHYSVLRDEGSPGTSVERLVAGPYTMDEAFAKRRELTASGSTFNVYINEEESK